MISAEDRHGDPSEQVRMSMGTDRTMIACDGHVQAIEIPMIRKAMAVLK